MSYTKNDLLECARVLREMIAVAGLKGDYPVQFGNVQREVTRYARGFNADAAFLPVEFHADKEKIELVPLEPEEGSESPSLEYVVGLIGLPRNDLRVGGDFDCSPKGWSEVPAGTDEDKPIFRQSNLPEELPKEVAEIPAEAFRWYAELISGLNASLSEAYPDGMQEWSEVANSLEELVAYMRKA